MITANNDGQQRRGLLPGVVPVHTTMAAQMTDNGNLEQRYLLVEVP